MTTCRDIITYALRLTKVLSSGAEPSAEEAADGMVALQSLYDGWINNGMFGRLTDTYETANYTAEENERVIAPTAITVTFPTTVDDDDNGGDRAPRDLSMIETVLNGTRTVKVYDRTGWVSMLGLDLDDNAPLADRGPFGLAAALATSGGFGAMFGSIADISPDARLMAASFTHGLSFKLGTTRERTPAEYF